jgi:phage FluMu protein Com
MLLFPQQAGQSSNVTTTWIEVRCAGCGRLLQKMEHQALRPGKHIQIKCGHCKVVNDLVGTDVKAI